MTGMEMRHCTCQDIGIYRQGRRREPGSMSSVHVARALGPGHLECGDEFRVISVQQIGLQEISISLDTTRKERPFCVYIGGANKDKSRGRILRLSDVGLLENDRSLDQEYSRLVQQEQAHKNVTKRRRLLASKLADGILIAKNRSKGPAGICVSVMLLIRINAQQGSGERLRSKNRHSL